MGEPASPKTTRYPRSFGKYQILREAGRGGRGVVYEAIDTVLQRNVALKVALAGPGADPEAIRKETERSLVEARIGAHLPNHPHIVGVYEAGDIEGKQYLACEFVQGQSMVAWKSKPGIAIGQQVKLLRDVALAIEHAHKHGVVHRDLKPGNVLVDIANQPRVTDWGLAKMTGQAVDLAKATPGHIWGTPAYMSPEHARGLDTVDYRADVYSLGAMLHEILTGHPLYQGLHPSEAMKKVVNEAPPAPSTLVKGPFPAAHKPLESVCMKALSKDPAHRPASAKAFADELTKWLDGGRGTLRRTAVEAPPKTSKMPMLAMAGAAVVIVVIAVLVFALRSGDPPPAPVDATAKTAEEARGREREKQQAATKAADEARKEEAERGRLEQERMRQDLEARRRADEEAALKQQAFLLSQRQEAEERAKRAEEELRKAAEAAKPLPAAVPNPAVPKPPTPAPAPPNPAPVPAPGAPRNAPATPPTGEPKLLVDGVLHWEAEDYSGGDAAAEGRDFHDTSPGNQTRNYRAHDVDIVIQQDGAIWVGAIDPGEWLNFKFEGEGRYGFEFRTLAGQNATAHLEVDGVNVTGPVPVPFTPQNAWATPKGFTQRIPAGAHNLRFVFDTRVFGLDWLRLKKHVPQPVPSATALKDAEKTIRALFKADYARKTDLQGLAQKMLQEGIRTEGDPVGRYALLAEARELAAQAGDPATAFAAVDELDRHYAVDGAALKQESLAAASKAARTPESLKAVAETYLALAEQAAEKDDFETAVTLAGKAESAARGSQDAGLIGRIQARAKDLAAARDDFRSVKSALKTLEEKPDDPAVNFAVGNYRCFTRGDWARGLPMLAKGSDAAIAALAQKELAGADDLAKQISLGEAWHKAGEKRSGAVKTRHFARAAFWYEKALPGLAGLEKVKIEGQIDLLYKAMGGDWVRKGLVFWVEPGRDPGDPYRELALGAKYTNNGAQVDAASRTLSFGGSYLDYTSPDAVKSIERTGAIFTWVRNEGQFAGLVHRGDVSQGNVDIWLWIQGGVLQLGFNYPDNSRQFNSRGVIPNGKWVFCGVVWDERNVTLYIDGKEDRVHPVAANPIWPPRRSGRMRIGSYAGNSDFRGQMGFVMMYNRALSAAEVGQLYTTSRSRFR